jgi:hypothetical protein
LTLALHDHNNVLLHSEQDIAFLIVVLRYLVGELPATELPH